MCCSCVRMMYGLWVWVIHTRGRRRGAQVRPYVCMYLCVCVSVMPTHACIIFARFFCLNYLCIFAACTWNYILYWVISYEWKKSQKIRSFLCRGFEYLKPTHVDRWFWENKSLIWSQKHVLFESVGRGFVLNFTASTSWF